MLVAFPFKPAFPGVLARGATPSATITSPTDSPNVPGGLYADIGLRCRRSVAQWIGVYLQSFYGSAQIRYEWRGDILAIHDDPWDEHPGEQPHLVYPDADGRYEIIEPWLRASDQRAAELAHLHPDALAILAGDELPGAAPETTSVMAAYLCDHPGAHKRQRRLLEAALVDLHR
ncbi:hypothetical protein BU204_34325 [Actinophytocola xanthii]|uniref:Uncharacterized protein n=1 Tax=Actinophytocola xanthii TaxID=1912961 RepID=A0A1Q8C2K2_9PSEU|nr:hypothetical protein BU204_34325 [Actinophytocola xanthii]